MDKKHGSVVHRLLAIALPISAGRFLHIISHFFALKMAADLGTDQLAAGALALSSYLTILTLSTSIFYGMTILIKQQNTPQLLFKNGLYLALLIAAPAALVLCTMDKILLAFGQDPALVILTQDYFFFAAVGLFPLLSLTVIVQFYIGTGKPFVALWVELFSFPLFLSASMILVNGHFGLPQWGLGGISLASLFTQLLLLCLLLIRVIREKLLIKPWLPDWSICRSILKLGLPIGIQFGGELAAMAMAAYLMGYCGIEALAALQITTQYSLTFFMISFSLTQAVALTISAVAEQNPVLIKKILHASFLLLISYLLPVAIVFYYFPNLLANLYLRSTVLNPELQALIPPFFLLSAFYLFFDGIRNLLSGALRGLHESKRSTYINLSALWFISLPAAGFAGLVYPGGPVALRTGFLSGFVIASFFLIQPLAKKLRNAAPLYFVRETI